MESSEFMKLIFSSIGLICQFIAVSFTSQFFYIFIEVELFTSALRFKGTFVNCSMPLIL